MIINTGQRTDIPAFFSQWFANRLIEGYVLVRNPYNPKSITKYALTPDVVDIIGFCTKNPAPMFQYMHLLKPFGQYWYVTITPYGKDIEPYVPNKLQMLETFKQLSDLVGVDSIGWRYDPIFISNEWTVERHLKAFEYMARTLSGYTETVVISFIDLYQKTKKNFPEVKEVPHEDRLLLGKSMIEIGRSYGMTIRPCAEGTELEKYGADCSGCMTIALYEKAIHQKLSVPRYTPSRQTCVCYLSGDIGAYNTCGHMCRYCYANYDADTVRKNREAHDPNSPLLVGHLNKDDTVHDAKQESWIDPQFSLLS